MSESEQPQPRRQDPAEVLAGMAQDRQAEPIAPPDETGAPPDAPGALDRLAGEATDSAGELKDLAETEAPPVDEEIAAATGLSGRASLRARRRRERTIAGQQARVHAHLYKKTMIPLLLIVGAILLGVGGLGMWMLNTAQSGPVRTWWHSLMTLLVLVSFPLAAILFFGAWLFHRDLAR